MTGHEINILVSHDAEGVYDSVRYTGLAVSDYMKLVRREVHRIAILRAGGPSAAARQLKVHVKRIRYPHGEKVKI